MLSFVRPVKAAAILSCLYLSAWIGVEILAVRQTAEVINQIKVVQFSRDSSEAAQERATSASAGNAGFWGWITGEAVEARRLRHIVLTLGAFAAALAVLAYLREVANAKFSMEMVFHIREAVYDKLQHVGFGFHDRNSTGELINRALTDLQNVRVFVNSAVLVTLEIVLIVGGYIILLLTRSPWVAALALLPLPLWTWYILRFSKKAQPALEAVMEIGDKNINIITETIAGVHVVKAFATEQEEIRKYNGNCNIFFERVMKRIRLFANFTPVVRCIAMLSHLTLFLAAGILIIRGRLNPGDILMLGAAMGAILGRLQQISAINDQYQSAIVSARRLRDVLVATGSANQAEPEAALPAGPGAVRFEGVTFGYDSQKPVLCDVSFAVPGGSVVAIVGPTGAGKTTLVSLIARFYDPQAGRILIDETDTRAVSLGNLRSQVAYVFQETYLFSDTISANIAYGRPETQEGNIEAAARLAQAHEFIETMPRQYESPLGERGASLSGGQRQRLAIARAILSNPRILILDDATAAIDPETEDLIRRGMDFVMRDRTTFVIAHRISTVKRADIVLVLEDGRITQTGTHEELMEKDGHYREIASVQLYGDGDGEDGRVGNEA